jgi:hypothetical protein
MFDFATVAGAKPPGTLVKMRFSTEPEFLKILKKAPLSDEA